MKGIFVMKKTGMVKLLKFVNGAWRVVDFGVASKADVYTSMGYIVEW